MLRLAFKRAQPLVLDSLAQEISQFTSKIPYFGKATILIKYGEHPTGSKPLKNNG
jgi:hypothetical protein